MPRRFGDELRRLRIEAGKTMAELAESLGISVPYLSDVERGRRNPFTTERIMFIAELLQVDVDGLFLARVHDTHEMTLRMKDPRPMAKEVGAGLMRVFHDLDDDELKELNGMIVRHRTKREKVG